MLVLSLLPLLLATAGFATHSRRAPVPASALILPLDQTQIVAPTDPPSFVTLAVGFHNYSCMQPGKAGTWTSAGYVAQVFDISNLYPGDEFAKIQDDAYNDWSNHTSTDAYDLGFTAQLQDKFGITLVGQHYYKGSTGYFSPAVFDFRSNGPTVGNPDAIVIAKVTGDIPAPTDNPSAVHWQEMEGISGKLASTILRVYTKSVQQLVDGSPCEPGTPDDQTKFAAQFWLW
ncbi:hypothetical protein BJY52DRAFT_1190075 [Lactarius psammicola]|nr:hypothetical protein BJY52DRAFT_1190075 [Lactarius psammicola]